MDPQLLIRFPQFDQVFSCFKALYFKCRPGLHIAKMNRLNRLLTTGVFIYTSGGTHINLGNSWCLQMSVQVIFCLTSILFPNSEIKENNNEECHFGRFGDDQSLISVTFQISCCQVRSFAIPDLKRLSRWKSCSASANTNSRPWRCPMTGEPRNEWIQYSNTKPGV